MDLYDLISSSEEDDDEKSSTSTEADWEPYRKKYPSKRPSSRTMQTAAGNNDITLYKDEPEQEINNRGASTGEVVSDNPTPKRRGRPKLLSNIGTDDVKRSRSEPKRYVPYVPRQMKRQKRLPLEHTEQGTKVVQAADEPNLSSTPRKR